jgi:Putative metallopeptidase family (DUF6782)/N-terminal domain of anti-restriction factor ArdC
MSATATRSRKQYTAEERAEYRKAQRDEAQQRFAEAVETLQSTDGFQAWLRTRARFHRYSLHNTLMILSQNADATQVAPLPVWNKLGRHVRKGEHSIRIWVRMDWHRNADGQQPGEMNQWGDKAFYCEKHKRVCVKAHGYKLGPVFDISQTDGEEIPPAPEPAPVNGDSHAHLEPALLQLADELGFTVSTEALTDGSRGYCNAASKRIVIIDEASPNERIHVLVHELAHGLGVSYKDYGRQAAETIVEAATYIVLAGQGFDVTETAVPYVAGWSGEEKQLEKFAGVIDSIARRIETALEVK